MQRRNRVWARMIHLSISLCFQHLNRKKLVRQLLLIFFCDNVSKNLQFLSQIPIFHQTSIENLGELILLSKKNMGFKILVIGFSHSKLSEIQRNQTSPNRWGRSELYASFSIDFWNGLLSYYVSNIEMKQHSRHLRQHREAAQAVLYDQRGASRGTGKSWHGQQCCQVAQHNGCSQEHPGEAVRP